MSNQFELVSPPSDIISTVKFSPDPTSKRLCVSSWDKHVYMYDLRDENGAVGEGTLLGKAGFHAPVLDVCFGANEDEVYVAGLDCDVRKVDFRTSPPTQTVISSHADGVRNVVYCPKHNIVISSSWDATLHVHRPDKTFFIVPLPFKPFSIAISATKLVVAMASRAFHLYELETLASLTAPSGGDKKVEVEPWQRRESSLKFMTRKVACMPDDKGYASSSIEGRVAVEWFDPSPESQARKYAFKCHRQVDNDVDVVYTVNALAFHPTYGSFASGGGDGVVAIWDGITRRRVRQYQKFPSSVAALDFSGDGMHLVIAVSPGFEDGTEDIDQGPVAIFVRELTATEAKGKFAK